MKDHDVVSFARAAWLSGMMLTELIPPPPPSGLRLVPEAVRIRTLVRHTYHTMDRALLELKVDVLGGTT